MSSLRSFYRVEAVNSNDLDRPLIPFSDPAYHVFLNLLGDSQYPSTCPHLMESKVSEQYSCGFSGFSVINAVFPAKHRDFLRKCGHRIVDYQIARSLVSEQNGILLVSKKILEKINPNKTYRLL